MKKIIIGIIVIAVSIGGYFYYIKRIVPNNFVTSFCETLEYDGPESSDLWDFLLSDFEVKPSKSWVEYYKESKEKHPNISKEELFQIWKDIYMADCKDYDEVSIDFPTANIMTREDFKRAYYDFSFSHFSIERKEYSKNRIQCTGYVDVIDKGSYLGNLKFGGNHKFDIIAKNGSLGWKIIIFSIDY